MITVYEGDIGSGKSYMLARDLVRVLQRNLSWFNSGLPMRKVAIDFPVSKSLQEAFKDMLIGWDELEVLPGFKDCDVFMDDMTTKLDNMTWEHTPYTIRKWFRVHERLGCDIYANAQNFSEVNITVRRLANVVYLVQKRFGSKRPTATKPVVKKVWGLLLVTEVPRAVFSKERYDRKEEELGRTRPYLLRKRFCDVYDTAVVVPEVDWPPLECIIRTAPCGVTKHLHR